MKLGISEILEKADKAATLEEKRKILKDNYSLVLVDVLRAVYDPNIKFLLPKGPIDYEENPLLDCQNILYNTARTLYLYVEGGHPTLTDAKRLKLFQNFLGNLDKDDAILMIHMKDKCLPYRSLTKEVVLEIFPQLIPH